MLHLLAVMPALIGIAVEMAEAPACRLDIQSDVIVVGAGIIGSAVARALSVRGFSVQVIDPAPGEGASLGNAGLVVPSYAVPMSTPANLLSGLRSLGSGNGAVRFAGPMSRHTLLWMARFALTCRPGRVRRDTAVLHSLASESLALYKQLGGEGLDLQLREAGWLWAYQSSVSFRAAPKTANMLRDAGAICTVVSGAEAHQLEPGLAPKVAGGIWFPHEAVLDSARVSSVLLQDAIGHGAKLHRTLVTGAPRSGSGSQSIRTREATLSADHIVIAAGADSRAVGALFGDSIPVEPGYGWSITLKDDANTLDHALMAADSHVVISPLAGRVRITGGMQFGGRPSKQPSPADIWQLRTAAQQLLPALQQLEPVNSWRGARPMTTTGLPIVDRSPRNKRVLYATGHGSLGVTLAPLTAELVASMVAADRQQDFKRK